MSPHTLSDYCWSFLFSWPSVQRLPLLNLQEACTLLWYFLWAVHTDHLICVWTQDTVCQRLCPCQSHPYSPLMTLSPRRPDSLVPFQASCCIVPSSWINGGPSHGLEDADWQGSCSYCSKLGPASGTNSGMFSLPWAELCSLLTSTSRELTWVLLSWWSPREPLEEWCHFFSVGPAMNLEMGIPLGECLQRGCLAREVLEEEQFQLDELDCLRDLELVITLAWVVHQ